MSKDFKYRRKSEPALSPDCVFTPAANINNRSLFPCQEPPIAMASWQAVITVSQACTGKLIWRISKVHILYFNKVIDKLSLCTENAIHLFFYQ